MDSPLKGEIYVLGFKKPTTGAPHPQSPHSRAAGPHRCAAPKHLLVRPDGVSHILACGEGQEGEDLMVQGSFCSKWAAKFLATMFDSGKS
mgnify:CR=1 FL=1